VCTHTFCTDCWVNYLMEQLRKGVEGIDAPCMQAGCNVRVGHSQFLRLLEGKFMPGFVDRDEKAKGPGGQRKKEAVMTRMIDIYWKWMCKNFTDENKEIKWCP